MKTELLFQRLISRLIIALVVLGFATAVSQAHAQLTKIFVASYGNDANDGSRGAPKRNFQAAHDAVASGGQVVVLDTAGYGALNIGKSLSVTVPPGVNGFITVSGNANGINITNAGSASISLRGLIIEGGGANGTGHGIHAHTVGTLTLEDCTIRNFFSGVYLDAPANPRLLARGVVVRDCFHGFDLENSSNASTMSATVTDCTVSNVASGVYADVTGSAQGINATASRCVFTQLGTAAAQAVSSNNARIVLDACTVTDAPYVFYKSPNQGTFYTRSNNTGAFVTFGVSNDPSPINTLGPF